MKLNSHNNSLNSNVQDETQDFGIGNASVVIDILRNRLYENKIQTLVQEYICNARDAMREVFKPDHAFDIFVPQDSHSNILGVKASPVFRVRDYGPGISPDRMKNVFILYGASTKRTNNTQTGGFGIGAKSAWSYTDSFTIISVYNGSKRVYVAHTGVSNNGRLDLLSETPTDEANGTEIAIPVKHENIREFENAIFRATYFWENKPNFKGTTSFLNRTKGYCVGNVELVKSDDMPSYLSKWNSDSLAVIDGIPYILSSNIINKCPKLKTLDDLCKQRLLLHFGNGVVEVSASRESIADSETSVNALNALADNELLNIRTNINTVFAAANSTQKWIEAHKEYSKYFKLEDYNTYDVYEIYNGDIHCNDFNEDTGVKLTLISNMSPKQRRRNARGYTVSVNDQKIFREWTSTISLSCLNALYFNSKDESKQVVNKRLREIFKTQTKIILVESGNAIVLNKFIQDFGAKDLSTVSYPIAARKPREKRVKTDADEFSLHLFGYPRIRNTSLLKNTQKYLYYPVRNETYDDRDLNELENYLPGYKICGLGESAIKQVKGNALFTSLDHWLKNYNPSKETIENVISSKSVNYKLLNALQRSVTNDVVVNDMIYTYKNIKFGKYVEVPKMLKDAIENHPDVISFIAKDTAFVEHRKKYPLLQHITYMSEAIPEIVDYINSKVPRD